MNYKARKADLDDWLDVQEMYAKAVKSPQADRLGLTETQLRWHFKRSLVDTQMALLLVYRGTEPVGLSLVYEIVCPGPERLTFIHVCYVSPGAGRAAGDMMNGAITAWAVKHGHHQVCANVRAPQEGKNNFKLRAIEERYGFTARHLVISREARQEDIEWATYSEVTRNPTT